MPTPWARERFVPTGVPAEVLFVVFAPPLESRHIPSLEPAVLRAAEQSLNTLVGYLASGAEILDGQTMSFTGGPPIQLLAHEDDSSTAAHFDNRSLQFVDPGSEALSQHLLRLAAN